MCFETTKIKKNKRLQVEANYNLNLYIQRKLFSFWRERSVKVQTFKKKIHRKLYKICFKAFKSYQIRKIVQRHKQSTLLNRKTKNMVENVFKSWSFLSHKKTELKRIYQNEMSHKNRKSMTKFLSQWKFKTNELMLESKMLNKANDFSCLNTLSKAFSVFVCHSRSCKKVCFLIVY